MSTPTQTTANKSNDMLVARADTNGVYYFVIGGIRLYVGTGTPNGEITAPKGSVFIEIGGPKLYQNTDASTTWQAVGAQS